MAVGAGDGEDVGDAVGDEVGETVGEELGEEVGFAGLASPVKLFPSMTGTVPAVRPGTSLSLTDENCSLSVFAAGRSAAELYSITDLV